MLNLHCKNILDFFKKPPIQLCVVIFFVVVFGEYLPYSVVRSFYTFSLFIKDIIINILPVVVAVFIASTLKQFQKKALFLVTLLLVFEGISNAMSTMYAYGAAHILQGWLCAFDTILNQDFQIVPYFQLGSLNVYGYNTSSGVMVGVATGLSSAFFPTIMSGHIIDKMRDSISYFLSQILSRVIPLYVLGFVLFMQHSGLIGTMLETYGVVILLVALCVCFYLFLIFVMATFLGKNTFYTFIQNILPTSLIASTTMSSAATMPYTIEAAEKNLRIPGFARMLIPATTNIQQVGDCITNAFLCLVILKTFGHSIPDIKHWLIFVGVFTLARYSTAAVMGGAIYIMIPIYKETLGFNDEMIAVILALNIVLDPLVTASNVLANGGLAVIFESIWMKLNNLFHKRIAMV